MRHVDVVKNEWLAGYQVVVARIKVKDGALAVDASEPIWDSVVRQTYMNAETGAALKPSEPDAFLEGLHEVMDGDYLFATEPHDEDRCPYAEMVVALQPVRPGGTRITTSA